ncbi:MAG TPA: hypothetical protein VGQ53_13485 [Chitinophagaceae bacterium]|jgi:hypothetical protein|nr:hypothetical protein [Chitinophagaceae bacterium]
MTPKHVRKTGLLILGISFTALAFPQKNSNPKIGKNETEVSSFIMNDNDVAFGAEVVYRFSVTKNLKIGGGVLYGVNYEGGHGKPFGYGVVFADAMQFLGQRQKWSFGGQIGQGIYNHDYGYDLKLKAGVYYSISCNYRAMVSKRVLFSTSLLMGKRNFHPDYWPGNSGFLGLRFGIVF